MKNINSVSKTMLLISLVALLVAGKLSYDAAMKEQRLVKNSAVFDMQIKCSNAAKNVIKEFGWDEKEAHFFAENHYNIKLNKCYVMFGQRSYVNASKDGFMLANGVLLDVLEGKELGEYSARYGSKDVMNDDAAVIRCSVMLVDGSDEKCNSIGEFKKLAKVYMND